MLTEDVGSHFMVRRLIAVKLAVREDRIVDKLVYKEGMMLN
jgi:hypothetical protein